MAATCRLPACPPCLVRSPAVQRCAQVGAGGRVCGGRHVPAAAGADKRRRVAAAAQGAAQRRHRRDPLLELPPVGAAACWCCRPGGLRPPSAPRANGCTLPKNVPRRNAEPRRLAQEGADHQAAEPEPGPAPAPRARRRRCRCTTALSRRGSSGSSSSPSSPSSTGGPGARRPQLLAAAAHGHAARHRHAAGVCVAGGAQRSWLGGAVWRSCLLQATGWHRLACMDATAACWMEPCMGPVLPPRGSRLPAARLVGAGR